MWFQARGRFDGQSFDRTLMSCSPKPDAMEKEALHLFLYTKRRVNGHRPEKQAERPIVLQQTICSYVK